MTIGCVFTYNAAIATPAVFQVPPAPAALVGAARVVVDA